MADASSFDVDLLVLGAGSGGLAAAERAGSYGVKVAIVEEAKTGGACVNYGCIPEKLLDYAAGFREYDQMANGYGWSRADRRFKWTQFLAAKEQYLNHLNQLHRQHLSRAGVELIRGHGSFQDQHTVLVNDRRITARTILIAVGAKPRKLDLPGFEQTITWRELYHFTQQPEQIAIVGDDPIAVKIVGSLNGLGSKVTQVIRGDSILPELDHELAGAIQQSLSQQGVNLLTQAQVKAIQSENRQLQVKLSGSVPALTVDTVLYDAGRTPNLDGLNLDKVGIQVTPEGFIPVDQWSKTTCDSIFAVGDCTGRIPLTPSAIAQARAFADTQFGEQPHSVDLDWVPRSVSSHPEAATIGLSELDAKERWGQYIRCYYTRFTPLLSALSPLKEQVWVKLVVNQQDSQRVLGVHMVGRGAVDVIQTLGVALRLGVTKPDLDRTIGIHPSGAEEIFSLK